MNTTYFKNMIMGNVFGTDKSKSFPSKFYVGFSSTEPTLTGTNVTEATGGGYKRMELTSLTAPTGGVITNDADIQFPESQSDWFGAATPANYYVIYDAETNGNLLMYDTLTKPRIIQANTVATILKSSLVIKLID